MSKNYQVLAKKIIDIVGVDNVESVTHCQTRLRFVVKDPKQIDKAALEDLDEVKGVFSVQDSIRSLLALVLLTMCMTRLKSYI